MDFPGTAGDVSEHRLVSWSRVSGVSHSVNVIWCFLCERNFRVGKVRRAARM